MKINGNSFLLMVTVLLFIVMYAAGMVIFADKGFAKPQMFLNLFISNAGLLVIAMGQTIVMITGGIDISVGSVTALVCMLCAYDMEKKGMSAYMAVAIALLIGLLLVSFRDSWYLILKSSHSSYHLQVCSLDVV